MMAGKKTPKWPHDHADKHAQAARLGWKRRRAGNARKFGGNASHTQKHLTKQTTRPTAAKRKKVSQPTAPKIVISRTSGGRWIINRVYPDGHVAGQPGTYATEAAAKKAAATMKHGVVVKSRLFEASDDAYGHSLFG